MDKGKTSNCSGITLIALVVTIIVLLLLAGISIQMITGNNGILNRAGESKEETRGGTVKEYIDLWKTNKEADKHAGNKTAQTQNELLNDLENQELLINDERTRLEAGETITIGSKQISLGELDEFEEVISGVESDASAPIRIKLSISGTKVANPPIPAGFSHSTGTVSDGYVITDGTNEFVWVPVDKNQKIKLEVTANENISSIRLYHPDGSFTSYTANGTSYENSDITPTTNGIYGVTVTTENNSGVKILQVFSLYEKVCSRISNNVLNFLGVSNINQIESAFESYGPANVDYAVQQAFQSLGSNSTCEDTEDYTTSVENNGGFYIARYEAGVGTTKRTTVNQSASVDDIVTENGIPVSKAGNDVYTFVTRDQAKGLAEKMYTGKSYLITGAGWDRTLGWLVESNNKTMEQIFEDSKDWGNYSNSSFTATGTGSLAKTGAFGNNTKSNNIFDLAGNVDECTSEMTYSGQDMICWYRGGRYSVVGSEWPSSKRWGLDYSFFSPSLGFRVALFL